MLYLSRAEQLALLTILVLLITGAGVLTYARGQHSVDAERDQPVFVPAPDGGGSEILVDVSGAVVRPGVYRLSPNARVSDAVERAGGSAAHADLTSLNLAAPLNDGDKLIVPSGSDVSPSTQQGPSPSAHAKRISLNQATVDELESLPGIGPIYAQRIVEYREKRLREEGHGYQSSDELLNVPGIGPKRFAAVRDLVTP